MKTLLKTGADQRCKILKDLIYLKELVAHYMWFVLTGSLVISVATNSIINAGCSYNEDAIKGLLARSTVLNSIAESINKDSVLM